MTSEGNGEVNRLASVTGEPEEARPEETIIVNGVHYPAPEEEFHSLLAFLLVDLGRTDQRFSCRSGQCGTCMLRMDGKWTKSCITPARWAIGKEVLTQGELIRIKQEERARAEAEAARAAAAEGGDGSEAGSDADGADGTAGGRGDQA